MKHHIITSERAHKSVHKRHVAKAAGVTHMRCCVPQAVSEAGDSVIDGLGSRKSSKGATWVRKAEVLEQARSRLQACDTAVASEGHPGCNTIVMWHTIHVYCAVPCCAALH